MNEMKDMNQRKIDRRDFLKGAVATGIGLALGGGVFYVGRSVAARLAEDQQAIDEAIRDHKQGSISAENAQATVEAYMTGDTGKPRVVHIRDADATNWSGSGWYGNAVNQTAVDAMVERGLQELTGSSSWADIWNNLFSQVQPSGYQTGQKIAIKVSFNNSSEGCGDSDNEIDALPQPVSALITGLTQAGVQEQDIWIYDATKGGRIIPDRFRSPILSGYPDVVFFGKSSCPSVTAASFSHVDPSLEIEFSDPDSNLSNRWLPDLLYQATYVINMPILKRHGIHPVSLGFKNHFGSLDTIIRLGNDNLHNYIKPTDALYEPTYSPMVDIFSNPNIRDKTMLTVGDGLYGAAGATQSPSLWSTFGDEYPKSLFFAIDPVAVDCVMTDFVRLEWTGGMEGAHDFLFCAQERGLGICEGTRSSPGGNPWGSSYSDIEYIRLDL